MLNQIMNMLLPEINKFCRRMTSTCGIMAGLPDQWRRVEGVRNASDIHCAVDELAFTPISVNCFILECSRFRGVGRRDRGVQERTQQTHKL